MSSAASEVLRSFRELGEREKREVAAEVVRWLRESESPELTEQELATVADELFLQYDADETPGE